MNPAEFAGLSAQIEALHEDVLEVKGLAQATNGRVRALEVWRAKTEALVTILLKGRDAAASIRRDLVIGAGCTATGGLVTFIVGHVLH